MRLLAATKGSPGDGYPSCDVEPSANVSDETDEATDTLADG